MPVEIRPDKAVFTVGEVAEIANISSKTVRRLVERGKLKRADLGIRSVRITNASLKAWLGV